MLKKCLLAAATGAMLLTSMPAQAQYFEDYGYRRPPPSYGYERPRGYGYDRPRYEYERPRGYDRPRYEQPRGYGRAPAQRGGFSDVCVTSRGNCATASMPIGANCRCNIPGFGRKRGNIM